MKKKKCNPPEISDEDCFAADPAKCNHECCQDVVEPVIRWRQVEVPIKTWEHAIEEEKCPFCKTDGYEVVFRGKRTDAVLSSRAAIG